MNERQCLGRAGEQFASEVLQQGGYEILKRNFRCKEGEIDIIAQRENELFFIEVKTRRGAAFGAPCEAVDQRKRQHMRKAAAVFLSENRGPWEYYSFQVIEVGFNKIDNAF